MKFNPITSAIAIAIAALIAYGFYSFGDNTNKGLIASGSFIMLGSTLLLTIGTRYSRYPTGLNSRVISLLFFLAAFSSHVVFSFFEFTVPAYIITHGIMALLYLLCVYFIIKRSI